MAFNRIFITLIAVIFGWCALRACLPKVTCDDWDATAKYEVWLPNADDPIAYDVVLHQQAAPADSLAPCSYLIVSKPAGNDNDEESFAAYFDGNFFRFRGDKMVEWHIDSDPIPFSAGMHRAEMFASILPAFINEQFLAMQADSAFSFSIDNNPDGSFLVNGSETKKGYLMRRFSYTIDTDGSPRQLEITVNPGESTEQVVSAKFSTTAANKIPPISEDFLARKFPEQFGKFRKGNFSLQSLLGKHMPTFSLPSTAGQRITHHRGEHFDAPTLIVVVSDIKSLSLPEVRKVARGFNIIYVFTDNDADAITDAVGPLMPGESIAFNGTAIVRDCAITSFPAFIFCNDEGIIDKINLQ